MDNPVNFIELLFPKMFTKNLKGNIKEIEKYVH